ncbi:hypothetical protein GCM10010401_23120 [Rarobacter faecitabidus]|uniref:ATP-dependent DNA helicase RecG n=1 Tax=Rarobacter faecitabidus TaxID=13243 RepID=A0A542ZWD5_RARFA|nr:OB-fold nucleic acid binding domain-containing protein [Rarobacter faecitabidus]TQL64546.1 ATP-dependent DNA helicase RecG [Rarobacter faecitabidus]
MTTRAADAAASEQPSLSGRLKSLFDSRDDMAAADSRALGRREPGTQTCAQAARRGEVTLIGRIRSVLVQPRGSAPSLEVQLDDGTGMVRLVWLGRRRIPGIEAGRELKVRGFVNRSDSLMTIYNPRYELRAVPGER